MNDEQESDSYRLVAWVLGIAVTIALVAAVIPGIVAALGAGGSASATAASTTALPTTAPATATPSAPAAPSPTTVAAAPAASSASLPVAATVSAKLYFASGKTDLPIDAAVSLKPVIDAVKSGAGSKAVISGYHDKTGNAEQNLELAKNRAKAVRDELSKGGLTEAQIELRKPQETEGGADDREARRVEVSAAK